MTAATVPAPVARLDVVVLDCPDPQALADFYGALLGLPTRADPDGSGWVALSRSGQGAPVLAFQPVEDYRRPVWPDGVPQQSHLDLAVADLAAAEARALELGATPLTHALDPTQPWRVYADPAGHPFCLCTGCGLGVDGRLTRA